MKEETTTIKIKRSTLDELIILKGKLGGSPTYDEIIQFLLVGIKIKKHDKEEN